jgi:hypothetical protein
LITSNMVLAHASSSEVRDCSLDLWVDDLCVLQKNLGR